LREISPNFLVFFEIFLVIFTLAICGKSEQS
jgi:hypothetical protein